MMPAYRDLLAPILWPVVESHGDILNSPGEVPVAPSKMQIIALSQWLISRKLYGRDISLLQPWICGEAYIRPIKVDEEVGAALSKLWFERALVSDIDIATSNQPKLIRPLAETETPVVSVIKTRFKMPVGVHLLLTCDSGLLMLLRSGNGYGSGYWSVVAGRLDGDEPCTSALVREAREEAGILIKAEDLRMACVMHRKAASRETVEFFYFCSSWSGDITNLEPEKCSDLCFVSLDALPADTLDYIRAGIEAAVNGDKYIEFGWQGSAEPSCL